MYVSVVKGMNCCDACLEEDVGMALRPVGEEYMVNKEGPDSRLKILGLNLEIQ